jgi:molecular chaperone GrpE
MLSTSELDDIVDRFRQWLYETNEELNAASCSDLQNRLSKGGEEAPGGPGLLEMVEAFTAMRHDAKLLAKGVRVMQDDLREGVATITDGVATLERSKIDAGVAAAEAARLAARPLLELLLDLDDTIAHAIIGLQDVARHSQNENPWQQLLGQLDSEAARLPAWRSLLVRWGWSWAREQLLRAERTGSAPAVISSVIEGLTILGTKIGRALADQGVRPLTCLGQRVDPNAVRVVDVVVDARTPPETVVSELRKGYTWNGEIIRVAEVRATRLPLHDEPVDADAATAH